MYGSHISSHATCPNLKIKLVLQEKLLPLQQWKGKRERGVVDEMQPQMIDFEFTIAHRNSKSLFLEKSSNFKDFS